MHFFLILSCGHFYNVSVKFYSGFGTLRLNYSLFQGAVSGSVQASDRLMKELRDVYRSQSYKAGEALACWPLAALHGAFLFCFAFLLGSDGDHLAQTVLELTIFLFDHDRVRYVCHHTKYVSFTEI